MYSLTDRLNETCKGVRSIFALRVTALVGPFCCVVVGVGVVVEVLSAGGIRAASLQQPLRRHGSCFSTNATQDMK